MISRKPGVRPINFSSIRGFTLVELMVAITLIGIVVSLALPSYSVMIEKRKLTSSAQQLSAFINQGHTEAARRNQAVSISYWRGDHDTWCVGAALGEVGCVCTQTNSEESDYCAIEGVKHVLGNADFGDRELVHNMDGDGTFSFDPFRGSLLEDDDDMFIELHTDSRDYKINLEVNESGNVRLCSKDELHDLPGYEVC